MTSQLRGEKTVVRADSKDLQAGTAGPGLNHWDGSSPQGEEEEEG